MEVKRKFLVKQLVNLWEFESKEIEQCYISFKPEVRIRKSDDNYTLTIKSVSNLEREEVEITITKEKYQKLKKITDLNVVYKTRYFIPMEKYTCKLDVYHNIKGLITVEVEFESKKDANNFIVPDWFGEEITNIEEFKNKNLAQYGFPKKLKCPICMGKGGSYDRRSMAHYTCSKCGGKGVININLINIGEYNQLLNN